VFEEAQLGKEQPFMKELKSVFTGATPRPVTPKYAQVTYTYLVRSCSSEAVSRPAMSPVVHRRPTLFAHIVPTLRDLGRSPWPG